MTVNDDNLYPIDLVKSELRAHKAAINEYQEELSVSMLDIQQIYKPDLALIKSQPELTLDLRAPLLDFLYKVTKRTKLAVGIFYDAVKLLDRYCSKRVVLKSQAQLVGCTCIWLAAKHEGGCNHIVNSLNKPINNRYMGPTQRSRIPRLIEFVQLCGPSCGYDEGMFVQMERHILNTLEWSISQPSVYNWCLNLHEIQLMNDSIDNEQLFDFKKLFYMKNFIIELSSYSSYFIMQDPSTLSTLIKKLLSILILNEENHFNFKQENLKKILSDNKVESYTTSDYQDEDAFLDDDLIDVEHKVDVFTTHDPKDNLIHYHSVNDNGEINRLIYAIATVSNTIYQTYTNTEYKEVNQMIAKIHKVSVSHIMALKEEEKELKRQQQEKEQQIALQQQQQQQQMYMNSPGSSLSVSPSYSNHNNNGIVSASQRSPSVYSYSSSNSDYEDTYSTFSGRKGSYDTTVSSVVSTPLPSPGEVTRQGQYQKNPQYVSKAAMSAQN